MHLGRRNRASISAEDIQEVLGHAKTEIFYDFNLSLNTILGDELECLKIPSLLAQLVILFLICHYEHLPQLSINATTLALKFIITFRSSETG